MRSQAFLAWELALRNLFLQLTPRGHPAQTLVDDGVLALVLSKIADHALSAKLAKRISELSLRSSSRGAGRTPVLAPESARPALPHSVHGG
eukprot:2692945-Pyramimonas_sp.AAC.1